MLESDQRLTPGMLVGDYHLMELLHEGTTTRTWSATQVSVNREVVIDSLNRAYQNDSAIINTFLSDVRTKAKVDHPLIGSVFEAVREEHICFYTREKIAGNSLQDLVDSGSILSPEEMVHVIKQIAEANLYLESHSVASLPLAANQVYVSSTNMCRIINMAVGGKRDHNVSTQDKVMLGNTFRKLLNKDSPGATRTKSLLQYMADTEREIPLTWEQIKDLSEGVERQLCEPSEPISLDSHTMKLQKKQYSKRLMVSIGIAVGLLLAGIFTYFLVNREKRPKQRQLEGEVLIAAGNYKTFDGIKAKTQSFLIDAHEVTIAEYAAFLKDFALLDLSRHEAYQHENHPTYKLSYLPDDWDNLYQAAKDGGTWNGLKVTLNCPVVGVDWWDAYTFASYNNRRLPTQDEWMAALLSSGTKPKNLEVSPWGPVDQNTKDITKNGIYGLAGNVSEWTLKRTKPTYDPTVTVKRPVICGAAFNSNLEGATKREWIQQDTSVSDARDIRRPNLGFRTVSQPESN